MQENAADAGRVVVKSCSARRGCRIVLQLLVRGQTDISHRLSCAATEIDETQNEVLLHVAVISNEISVSATRPISVLCAS